MSIEMKTNINNYIHNLSQLGWDSHFQSQVDQLSDSSVIPARVVGVRKNSYVINNGETECLATLAGRLKYDSEAIYPVTGDWVLVSDSVINKVLQRKNFLSRGASGAQKKQETQPQKEQVIAANLDTVFIVSGLDRDYNLRRIERYLTLIYNCGLNPVVILTKADLHPNPDHFVNEVETVTFGVPIHLISANEDTGLFALEQYLSKGKTITLMGSSGAGKSTLLNRLYGRDIQLTGSISAHVGKGMHTTTSRDLIITPQGGMVIDNPGIREIAFWEVDNGIESAFPDIEKLGLKCRFSNCSHTHEPGCRVLEAVKDCEISENRLENYRKMKREMEYLSHRQHKSADRVEKERWKDITMKIKDMKKRR